MIGFKKWIEAKGQKFPVENDFMGELEEFLEDSSETGGLNYKLMNYVGIFENKVNYIFV